jgi:hypothetical protein
MKFKTPVDTIAPVGAPPYGAEPLGPSECGHYDVTDIRADLDMIAVPFDSGLYDRWREGAYEGEGQDDER